MALFFLFPLLLAAEPSQYELVETTKIWDGGKHNAFTDLARWEGHFYCVFREGDGHIAGDGGVRVLRSKDGKDWESAALILEDGVDLRDPKIVTTPDDRLMIVAGGSIYRGTRTIMGRKPRVFFSKDGTEWSEPKPVLDDWEWLWRVTWHDGIAYGASYATGSARGENEWDLKLFKSKDGAAYEKVADLEVPGRPNETTLRFLDNGDMLALVRREAGDTKGWLGRSSAPYTKWDWKELPVRIGGPNFLELPDGRLMAVVRLYDKKVRTSVCELDPKTGDLKEVVTLPSGGDTSYAGMVYHDDQLWISYYSSHEGKTNIYLSRVKCGK